MFFRLDEWDVESLAKSHLPLQVLYKNIEVHSKFNRIENDIFMHAEAFIKFHYRKIDSIGYALLKIFAR